MRTKLTQSKRGRKKFSAGKLISPDKDLEENLALAGIGEFAVADQQEDRAIFALVALWESHYAPLFTKASATNHFAAHKRERITARILRIITSSLDRLDPKPFEKFIRAIKVTQHIYRTGSPLPLHRDVYEVLRVANEMNLTLDRNTVQTAESQKIFKALLKARLGRTIEERQLARIKKQIGLHFPSGRPKEA
jgi:hypothetical protein